MVDSTCASGLKIGIGGIKLSPELVQYTFVCPLDQASRSGKILNSIAAKAINLPFLSLSATAGEARVSLCVTVANSTIVRHLIADGLDQSQSIHCTSSVGTFSVFPHRYNFDLLGQLLTHLADAGIVIYGMCSSISALTVVIDFTCQEEAIRALAPYIELPANHAPFRQEFDIRQISP